MQALLNTAVKAARKGGDLALRYLNRVGDIEVRSKARNEFVTQVDHAAEAAIIDSIRERYPHHAILAEESGSHPGEEFSWIIDPLDGTTNFIHGFPVFSVSIAVKVRDQLEVGVVYDPCRQELYTATRGGGAQLDGRRIRVSAWPGLEGALIGTGFPYRSNVEWLPKYMPMLQAVMENTAGVRRPGTSSRAATSSPARPGSTRPCTACWRPTCRHRPRHAARPGLRAGRRSRPSPSSPAQNPQQ